LRYHKVAHESFMLAYHELQRTYPVFAIAARSLVNQRLYP